MASEETSNKHTAIEDAQGLGLGIFLSALGVHVLTHVGLITGQTAGVAVIISYLSGWSFGTAFFVINLPFYVLAYRRLGLEFTLKSLVSVSLLSALTDLWPAYFPLGPVHPAVGAVVFGALVGIGMLAMFRHKGSLGGFGVVALLVQDRFSIQAGYVQLATDVVIFAMALLLFPATVVMWSLLGAVVLNLIIAINHRRDRYIAT